MKTYQDVQLKTSTQKNLPPIIIIGGAQLAEQFKKLHEEHAEILSAITNSTYAILKAIQTTQSPKVHFDWSIEIVPKGKKPEQATSLGLSAEVRQKTDD
jgi:hypothetical protein